MATRIPFNRFTAVGNEAEYVSAAVASNALASDGRFTKGCSRLLEKRLGVPQVLMMSSCTAALEAAALLCGIEPGDEVIVPSFTFVSTANAFVRSGARPVFVDIRPDTLNLDESLLEAALSRRTKAIVPVHYAGVACEMTAISEIATQHRLYVVEDAAQAAHASYRGRALGTWGDFGTFSFHSTKNYACGEGGALAVSDVSLCARAEAIYDKGTNRQAFLRGELARYSWVEPGSSFAPSELSCAYLFGQLEQWDWVAERRLRLCELYRESLAPLELAERLRLPVVPPHCETNGHMFYLLTRSAEARAQLAAFLRERGIEAVSHYEPLHRSPMARRLGVQGERLPVTEDVAGRLLRLPLYVSLTEGEVAEICDAVVAHFR